MSRSLARRGAPARLAILLAAPLLAAPLLAAPLLAAALPALADAPAAAPPPPEPPGRAGTEDAAAPTTGTDTASEEAAPETGSDAAEPDAPAAAVADAPPEEATGEEPGAEAAASVETGNGDPAPTEMPVPVEAPAAAKTDSEDPEAADGPEAAGTPAPLQTPRTEDTGGTAAEQEDHEPEEPGAIAPPAAGPMETPAEAAACEAELAALGVVFEPVDPLDGEAPCGAPRPLRVTAVGGVALDPPAVVRCPPARALGLWVERVAAPLSDLYMDSSIATLLVGTSYQCRKRRGDGSGKFSEHAFANAIDVMGVVFEDGDRLMIAEREAPPEALAYQAGLRGGACAFFTTVLGPTTNDSHTDHLHIDMAERRGGYRLCE